MSDKKDLDKNDGEMSLDGKVPLMLDGKVPLMLDGKLSKLSLDESPVVKRKKGRQRKEISDKQIVEKVVEEKKKRGRKKKECVEEVKQKKKRGRKAAVKYFSSSIRKKIPLTTVLQDNNNYILHLDIQDEKESENKSSESENKSSESENDFGTLQSNDNISVINNESFLSEPLVNITKLDKKEIITTVFEELKKTNVENRIELQKEYDDILENDDLDVNELYERRIEIREKQDNILIHKLETQIKNKILNNKKENKQENEISNLQESRKRGFFEILNDFVENKEWLHTTSVCCWWCCHTFTTVPVGLPVYYDKSINKFRVKGVFCSFSCMIAYKNTNKLYNVDHNIKFLYSKLTGTNLLSCKLKPAPCRYTLKMFGGQLSIEDFRNNFIENKIYKMVEYPMFISSDYMEEIDIKNIKMVNHKLFDKNEQQSKIFNNLDDKRVEDAKTRLSIIENATVTVGNTIDKFIKFS
jgi:hypothetical protein